MYKRNGSIKEMFATFALALLLAPTPSIIAYNGDLTELECPDECECHYFRVNWVTDCSENNLTDIPFAELSSNAYILDLNGNFIGSVSPFPPDIKLRRLQLANNVITEVRSESIAELNYIIDADFADNRIRRVDPFTFENKSGFLTLELQDNPLDRVDGPFLYSNTLLYLDISSCTIDYLNEMFFENITSLSHLDLSSNPLKVINNTAFYPLTSLSTLKMNDCQLSYINESAFAMQANLKTLELARNRFKIIMWPQMLEPLVRLEHLDLRKSGLTELPTNTFDNRTYLRTLILAENNLGDFDVSTMIGQKLSHLEALDLSHCHLTRPLSEDAFVNAIRLRTLYLSGNTLFSSDLLVALAPLLKLQKLSLSHCGLSVMPVTLQKLKSLTELDISFNPLNDVFVHLLTPLDTLEYLNMGYSNLSYISPTTFAKMTSMKRLVLSGNDLNSLEAGLFGNLTHLESLELNSCGLRRPLNATVFFNNLTYTDLTELQLAGNPLTVAPKGPLLPKQLSRLQILDLSNCNLTFLPSDAFLYTRNITKLVLKGNHLTSGSRGLSFLEQLPALLEIDLRYNNLTTFSPQVIARNPDVEKLKLIGNPWRCECSVADLWDWALLEKGNLDILEGATAAAEYITAGKTKRKKLLSCNYEPGTTAATVPTNKTVLGRRGFNKPSRNVTSLTRTWAKYVRESGCEQNVKRAKRSTDDMGGSAYQEKPLANANHVPNDWGHKLIYVSILYFVSLLGLIAFRVWLKRRESGDERSVAQKLHKNS